MLASVVCSLLAALASPGVVVRTPEAGLAGAAAGLRRGDVLTSWRQTTNGVTEEGLLGSVFDFTALEYERHPLGPLVLAGTREGVPFEATVEPEAWGLGIDARPVLDEEVAEQVDQGDAAAVAGRVDEGAALLRAAAERLTGEGDVRAARCFVLERLAVAHALSRRGPAGRAAVQEAAACARALGPAAEGLVLTHYAVVEANVGDHEAAVADFGAARELLAGRPLLDAQAAFEAAPPLWLLRRLDESIESLAQAIERREHAPLPLSMAYSRLARALAYAGHEDAGDEAAEESVALCDAVAPDGPTCASALSRYSLARARAGDLLGGEQAMYRAAAWYEANAPESVGALVAAINLGTALSTRGDFAASERWQASALPIAVRHPSGQRVAAILGHNLGSLALGRGDLDAAIEKMGQAVRTMEQVGPRSYNHLMMIGPLAEALRRRGDLAEARERLVWALATVEESFPDTSLAALTYAGLAQVARAEGDRGQAEELYAIAVEIAERAMPGSLDLVSALSGLAGERRARGDLGAALALSDRALAIVDARRARFKGSDEARTVYATRFFGIYEDRVLWLVESGRVAEAFQLLERSRAGSLQALLAERDLLLGADLPPALERDRRSADAAYERTLARRNAAPPSAVPAIELELDRLRRRQDDIASAVREASPRLATLRSPEAQGAEDIARALGDGALFLTYSVGRDATVAFAVTGGADARLRAVRIGTGSDELARRVEAFRRAAERTVPPRGFRSDARALYRLLLAPFEAELSRAHRLVLSADGPLHALPFAALRSPSGYLVERLPLQTVLSGTLFAQAARTRAPHARAARVVAYGDPAYGPGGPSALPGGRAELRALARLFPGTRSYVGSDASERQVKGSAPAADYLHFAVHGLVDERSPLDSALLLAAPAGDGDENGRLHAWEIFENVRLSADLVTLSACRSALGVLRAGEGMVGLSRAFQFAGARTVVASLWDVGDRSGAVFMRRFYGALKRGAAKDEALRAAQVAGIRAGEHPVRWAAFKSFGDWR